MTTNVERRWLRRLRVIKMILKRMTGEADDLHQSLSIISPLFPSVLPAYEAYGAVWCEPSN